jgi:hypothetical protein
MIVKRIRFYSDGESKKKRIKLSEIKSHRGLGRSMLLGGGIMPGAIAGYVGKKAAEEADEQGLSDWEIKKAATEKGTKAGALLGGGLGLASGLSSAALSQRIAKQLGVKGGGTAAALATAAGAGLSGAAVGALGGYLGAEKNTRTRLKKRRDLENSMR